MLTAAEKAKNYRKNNPEKWKETISKYSRKKWTCDCGAVVCNKVRPRHLKTKKHIERMALIEKYKNIQN